MSDEVRPSTGEAAGNGSAAGQDAEAEAGEAFPNLDFCTFVLSLSHSVLVHLGDAPNPVDGKQAVSLPLARQTIDLLGLLEVKTAGNLTGEEERILGQTLYDLRLRYVEVARHHG